MRNELPDKINFHSPELCARIINNQEQFCALYTNRRILGANLVN